MKLFLNQFELDSSVEHELISNSKFYYDVEVVYEKLITMHLSDIMNISIM